MGHQILSEMWKIGWTTNVMTDDIIFSSSGDLVLPVLHLLPPPPKMSTDSKQHTDLSHRHISQ